MSTGTVDAEGLITVLYREHGPALLSFATRLTSGDHQWAEDVVQETLLRAWRSAVKVDESQPPVRSWLFTVARRIVLDGYRRRSARPKEVGDGVLGLLPASDDVEAILSSLAVSDALASLSEPHRSVLREIYFRGSTAETAAAALGVPVGTVKSRSYYALKALRLALEERGLTEAVGR
jgi:RNA polymerase sigma-70 factor (ECF subfamily)